MNTSARILFLLVAVTLVLSPPGFGQGSLTPPGPPAPTMKTLEQVEPRIPISALPFTISAPGSYYLTGTLTGQASANGITIAADDVTLDLGGHALVGVSGSLSGVSVSGGRTNISIFNGTVRGWGGSGVGAENASNSQLERLRASHNQAGGLRIGVGSTVINCVARANVGRGIRAATGSTLNNCTASNNTLDGIEAGDYSAVTNCTAINNAGNGIVLRETGFFLAAGQGGAITNCTANGNGGDGIVVTAGSTVSGCASLRNSGNGFVLLSSATITHCTARRNGAHGIRSGEQSLSLENNCAENGTHTTGGAGIYFTGDGARIEGNNCHGNGWGIQSAAGTNGFIVRNSCRGNSAAPTNAGASSNYDFDRASNTYGPVEVVNGDISTDDNAARASNPWANIQY